MRTMRLAVAIAAPVVMSISAGVAYACSLAPPSRPWGEIPGLTQVRRSDGGVQLIEVPRNVAALGGWFSVDGVPVELVDLAVPTTAIEEPFRRPLDLLPAGGIVNTSHNGDVATVGDYEDVIEPEVPAVTKGALDLEEHSACAEDSEDCSATIVRVTVTPPADDHTPSENIVYALYVAQTRDGARTMQVPTEILLIDDGELWTYVDKSLEANDVFVSVAAIDFAANHSERSEPIRVHRGDSGCAVTRAGRSHLMTWIVCAFAVIWVGRRGRRALATSEASGS